MKEEKRTTSKSKVLSKKEKGFADDYIKTGNGTESIINNYNTDNRNSAGVMANENLKKPKIRGYIDSEVEAAKQRIIVLAKTAKRENVKLSANQDIIDRNEGKATNLIGVDKEHPLEINITSNEKQAINKTLERYMGNTTKQGK